MATSSAEQHTRCQCAGGCRPSVWDKPIWTWDDIVDAFQKSESTLREWRKDQDAAFPAPADLPGRTVLWSRDGVLDWFEARFKQANPPLETDPSGDSHGGTQQQSAPPAGSSKGPTDGGAPPVPHR